MINCIFCRIASGEAPSDTVYEDDASIAILPEEIEVKGHTLILPKEHYENLFDIPEEVLSSLILTTKKLSIHYKEKLHAKGVNLLHASGKAAEQSVFHFHIHLIPRFDEDTFSTWPELPGFTGDRKELAGLLKMG